MDGGAQQTEDPIVERLARALFAKWRRPYPWEGADPSQRGYERARVRAVLCALEDLDPWRGPDGDVSAPRHDFATVDRIAAEVHRIRGVPGRYADLGESSKTLSRDCVVEVLRAIEDECRLRPVLAASDGRLASLRDRVRRKTNVDWRLPDVREATGVGPGM